MTMPSRFEWKQDNATQASGFDPYGEWSTGHGRAYDLTELEQRLHRRTSTMPSNSGALPENQSPNR
jgi:hypothetical protein